jgi:hypothetical protein
MVSKLVVEKVSCTSATGIPAARYRVRAVRRWQRDGTWPRILTRLQAQAM